MTNGPSALEPPTETMTYWCPQCGSHFIHDLGPGHLTQTAPAHRCGSGLQELRWFR